MSEAGLAGDSGSEVERGVQLSVIVLGRALDLSIPEEWASQAAYGVRSGDPAVCGRVRRETCKRRRERLRHSLRVPCGGKAESSADWRLPSGAVTVGSLAALSRALASMTFPT